MKPFAPAAQDPLGNEHKAVAAWIKDAGRIPGPNTAYREVELKSLPSGKVFLDAGPAQARRYVLAALARLRHLDEQAARVRAQAETDVERSNPHLLPGWGEVWIERQPTHTVLSALMRRTLPLEKQDLLALLDWCGTIEHLNSFLAPIGSIVKALSRYAAECPLEPDLGDAMSRFAGQLRTSYHKDAKRLGTIVEQLCTNEVTESRTAEKTNVGQPAPAPAQAGNPAVLGQLKRYLEIPSPGTSAVSTGIGPDRFDLPNDSPLKLDHELLTALFNEVIGTLNYSNPSLKIKAGKAIASRDPRSTGRILLAAAERHVAALLAALQPGEAAVWQSRYAAAAIIWPLLELKFELSRDELFDFMLYLSTRPAHQQQSVSKVLPALFAQVEREASSTPITEGERYVLHLFRLSLITGPPLGAPSGDVVLLTRIIGDSAGFFLAPGEAWTERVNAEMSSLQPAVQQQWTALLKHLLTATSARPSGKWLKTAAKLAEAIGADRVRDALLRWLPLVAQGQTLKKLGFYVGDTRGSSDVMHEENATCLRGLLWLAPALPNADEFVRPVTKVALSAYKKVPGVGPRAVKVGNAAIYALSEIGSPDAVGQLAMLKVRMKFGTAQKEIEKAFNAAAEALGLPRDQIEEMSVPSYGLEEVGIRRETFRNGEFVATLQVDGRDVTLAWSREDGKPQKAIPAAIKSEHGEELKELQTAAKDIAAMLPAQTERIDSLFLLQKRWPLPVWRERYLDHPLIGTIVRRLIWSFRTAHAATAGIWLHDRLARLDGTLDLPENTEVELWHPIARPLEEVLAWRAWLEDHAIRQPFKQAHREIYLLTDAERQTHTYTNRFAAHVLRQHQFNALCAARGWKNKLRLMVDAEYSAPVRELPAWGLRSEFWIESIGAEYGIDTNDSGAFLRVATDQVRFYRIDAAANIVHAGGGGYASTGMGPGAESRNEPIPLEQIPPFVFSEIMRDIDLFVGVASVGNDPAWQDGGPGGRYRDYWQSYAFGDLTESAKTRRAVLERLLPRLTKIESRCSIRERFLVVRGNLHTYKIHLGSGNVLMEPTEEYLCIVPSRGSATSGSDYGNLFLPFEGDATLSIILSKAFLLAEDTKITDSSITRQIRKG